MTLPNPKENNFTFKTEKPIKTVEEDETGLNMNNFAEYLATNIKNYFEHDNESITIGLMGDWGSGKTSILNLTENHLKQTDILIIKFNPWIYSSYNQLIEQFFDELIKRFYSKGDYDLGDNIKEYWFKINKLDLVKSIIPTIVSSKFKILGKILKDNLKFDSEEKTLKKLKDKINTKLLDYKIVCIIDDLDRVTSEEIQEMFKLIKIMADFYNIIYVVSFDRKIVSKSLDAKYIDGKKYIEKIINIPLEVPLITEDELKDILINDLKTLCVNHEIKLDEDRLNSILSNWDNETKKYSGILYFFKTIRDVKRFINLLEFNIELVKNEVNFTDFTAITAIELFKPEIYEKIKYNEYLLVKYLISKNEYSSNPKIEKIEQDAFEKIIKDDDNIKYLLQTLFPKMSFIYNTKYGWDYSAECDSKLLICHPNHFKTYFKLNPIIKKITEQEISLIISLINSKKEEELLTKFEKLDKEGNLNLFFDRLQSRIDQINEHEFCLKLIFSLTNKVNYEIFNENRFLLKKICLMLIANISSNKRFEILKKEYENMDHINFLFELLIHIQKHNNLSGLKNEVILKNTEIDELKKIITDKYRFMLNENFDYMKQDLRNILQLGMELKLENEVKNFVDMMISSNDGLIEFLRTIMYPDMDHFLEHEIREISYFTSMEKIKIKIDENYDDLKEVFEIKKFLKEYEIWKNYS